MSNEDIINESIRILDEENDMSKSLAYIKEKVKERRGAGCEQASC